ncbi:MAG: NusG domain II-containing protein [Treponema sp.]|nr:NusG domain II-containing protein [Treponema sp.]
MKFSWPLKPADYGILLTALGSIIVTALGVYAKPQAAQQVWIRSDAGTWVYPLDAEERVRIPGPLGDTVVAIRNRQAAVLASPCANQTCVAAGHINAGGQWLACLPNRVFVLIQGSGKDAPLDASAQ